MLTSIHPKLPMRNKAITRYFYINKLGFSDTGIEDYDGYLILKKDNVEIHFFEFTTLNPDENYGQIYIRVNAIDNFYQTLLDNKTRIHPNGLLEVKPWRQKEFSILDPDKNLLTFGESVL
jgi:hypothetical protein